MGVILRLLALLLGFCFLGGVYSSLEILVDRAATPPSLQQTLIAEGEARAGDPELGKEYKTLNEKHFHGELPAVTVAWEPRLEQRLPGQTPSFRLMGLWGQTKGRGATILLNPRLKKAPTGWRATLCHEMIHEYLHARGDDSTNHGPAFQTELRRLWSEGAFEGEPADEKKRKEAREWLEAKKAEIERLETSLAQRKAVADAAEVSFNAMKERIRKANEEGAPPPSRIEALAVKETIKAQIDSFNSLLMLYRQAIEDFNDHARTYNLMNAYPDGMDDGAQRELAAK